MVLMSCFPDGCPGVLRRSQDSLLKFDQVEEIRKMDWDTLVGGPRYRVGTHADVEMQAGVLPDIKQAAATALATTRSVKR